MRGKATMAAIAAMAAATVCVTGCGSSVTPTEEVAKAADKTVDEGGVLADYKATVTVPTGSVDMSGTGSFDLKSHRGTVKMTVPTGQGSVDIEEVQDGQVLYMKSPGFNLPGGKQWVKMDLAKVQRQLGLSQLIQQQQSLDPTRMLDQLRTTGEVTKVGSEQLGDVDTTHYHASVDVRKVVAKSTSAAGRQRLLRLYASRFIPIDVWVDGDDHVRREQFSIAMHMPAQPGKMTMAFRVDLHDFGTAVNVQPPAPDDVVDVTQTALDQIQSSG
jgi:hypothetical protein